MALAGDCARDREPFSKQQERGGLDYNPGWDLNPRFTLLFDPSFNTGLCQDIFSTGSSDCDRDSLASEIQKRLMKKNHLGRNGLIMGEKRNRVSWSGENVLVRLKK